MSVTLLLDKPSYWLYTRTSNVSNFYNVYSRYVELLQVLGRKERQQ